MPAPNDLTPEEEAMFSAHGVEPAGPGQEPTGELNQPVVIDHEPASPHGDRQPQPRADNGQFTQADPNAPAAPAPAPAAPADPNAPVDPNAPPVDPNAPLAPPQPGFVPHAALHQERMRANNLAQQNAMLLARTNAILANQQPQVQPLPDIATDPVGYVTELGQRMETFQQQTFEEQQNQRIHSAIEADEQNFRQLAPDYDQASEHYVQSRAQELLHLNYSPQQAQQIMLDEARQMAQQAWQRGVPAAQMVYQMAQARGYRPGMPQTSQQMTSPAPFNPRAPAQQPQGQPQPAPTGPTAAAQVAAIKTGQAASRSLSGGAGAAPAAQLNAEALLAMSDEEFEAHFALGSKGANARFANVG